MNVLFLKLNGLRMYLFLLNQSLMLIGKVNIITTDSMYGFLLFLLSFLFVKKQS